MEDTALEFDKDVKKPKNIIRETRVGAGTSQGSLEKDTMVLDMRQKSLVQAYTQEPKVSVRVAPSYAKYFGRIMRVSINGISVAVPCNGTTLSLPASFADEVMRRMAEMDKYELRASRMANASQNFETNPGQINFFGI